MSRKQKLSLDKIKKILIIRIDRIGDLVCTIPSLLSLKKYFPVVKISALLSPANSELLKDTGLADEIIVWNNKWSLQNKKIFIKGLKDRNFDLVLAFSPLTEAYRLASVTEAPIRGGIVLKSRFLTKLFASFCLNHIYFLDQEGKLSRKEPVMHEVDKGLALLELLGIQPEVRNIELNLPDNILKQADDFLNSLSFKDQKGIIGIPLCCRYDRTSWSPGDLGYLVERLREKFPAYLFFITYGESEEEQGKTLEKLFRNRAGIAVKGYFPLQLWAALIKKMSLVISIDSGAVHIAASGKVPLIVLYPEEIYELCSQEWRPWNVSHRQLVIKRIRENLEEIIEAVDVLLK